MPKTISRDNMMSEQQTGSMVILMKVVMLISQRENIELFNITHR